MVASSPAAAAITGLTKVKQELEQTAPLSVPFPSTRSVVASGGPQQHQLKTEQSSQATARTAAVPAATLTPKVPIPVMPSAGIGQQGAAGATAGAGAAAAAAMFANGFPASFFNPAAFAAAAAAAFPNLAAAPNGASPPLLGGAAVNTGSCPAAPESKRRKRGRGEDKSTSEVVATPAAASSSGSPGALPVKTDGFSPQPLLSPAVGLGGVGGAVGGGGAVAWAPPSAVPGGGATLNVLTPNLFGGEMSNQERKERRKIRNRMSAQQHRERQRQRVDTLEDHLREREGEITKLKEQVASLTEKNKRLTSRVLQLEAGECPDLQDVLDGLEDESSLPAAAGTSVPTPTAAVGSCVPSSRTGAVATMKPNAAVGVDARTVVVGVGRTTGGEVAGGEDTDGGGVTTDQAHSSSESDSEDLSPLSTIESRSGQPSTPPLSPVHADPTNNVSDRGANANFSLSGLSGSDVGTKIGQSTSEILPSSMQFSVSAAVAAAASTTTTASGDMTAKGTADDFSTSGLLSSDLELERSTSSLSGIIDVVSSGREDEDMDCAGGGGGGGSGVYEAPAIANNEPRSGSWNGPAAGGSSVEMAVFGNANRDEAMVVRGGNDDSGCCEMGMEMGTGGVDEDELTMAALDPMEIDALLASCDEDVASGSSVDSAALARGDSVPLTVPSGPTFATTVGSAARLPRPGDLESGSTLPSGPESGSSCGREQQQQQQGGEVDRIGGGRSWGGRVTRSTQRLATANDVAQSSAPGAGAGADATGGSRDVRLTRGGSVQASGPGAVSTRNGVASSVAAGVMGALCLAGVVINSGPQGTGKMPGKELVVSPAGSAVQSPAGRRVLSSAEDDDEGEYANVTEPGTWVFHPVEAEPWRWRTTAARERRAPWVWERALHLFGDPVMVAGDLGGAPAAAAASACHDSATVDGAAGTVVGGGELVRSDDVLGGYGGKAFPPIAPPEDMATGLDFDADFDVDDAGAGPGAGDLAESFVSSPESSGKELDLYHYAWRSDDTGDREVGAAGGVRGRRGGTEAGATGMGSSVPPAERTSYVFCPEAHGMMSEGMIERASKATYDYHHPGARPCPSGALGRAAREGRSGGHRDTDAEMKINVVDHLQQQQQQHDLSRSQHLRLLAGEHNPNHVGSMALVSNNVNNNLNHNSNGNRGVMFGSVRDEEALTIGEGGGAGAGGGGGRRRRRGPPPIHVEGMKGDRSDDLGDENEAAGPQGFHRNLHPADDAEYLTMLVPSGALDWGASSLAVRSALNATAADTGGVDGGGAWVEIECQVLSARLVQDVAFLA